MQVTETLSQGLKREYSIVLPATDLAARLDGQLADMKNRIKINGFRPGKVPVAHLKRVYGRSVMADVMQEAITEANKQIVDDNGLRLAQEPKVELPTDQASIEAALEARGDLNYKVALEVLPKFEVGAFDDISLERPVVDVEPADIDRALDRLVDDRRAYVDRPEGGKAETGDRVTVDFVGTIAGEPFEGGTSENIEVVLGSDTFIPGFETQLLGVAAGERRAVEATFPEAYVNRKLAGQKAAFDVTVKAVAAPEAFPIDDEFAKSLKFESLDKLKETITGNLTNEYSRLSREKLKRQLLDALDKRYSFELPDGLVAQEFELDLAPGRTGAEGFRPQLRRGEHHRGSGARRLSPHRRASGAPRFAAGRSRLQGRRQDHRRGSQRRVDCARARLSRSGKAGVGLLPQQPAGPGRTARADLRREGGRLHSDSGQGGRAQGDARRAHEARRGDAAGRLSGGVAMS